MPITWNNAAPKIEWDKEPSIVWDKPKLEPVKFKEPSFKESHPELYALGMIPIGTAKELSKVSFLKYIYPEERKKLSEAIEIQTEGGPNLGTRKLLIDTLEAVTIAGFKPLTGAAKTLLKRYLPKTYGILFETPIGKKGEQTVAQKIAQYKAKNKGEHPSQEAIKGWWNEAAKKVPVKEPSVKPVVIAAEGEEVLPKYAQSINLEKQAISDKAKLLELEMAGKKKVQPWDKTGELSEGILKDMEKTDAALKKIKGLEGLTENMEAVRQINVNQISQLATMAEEVRAGTLSEDAFNAAFIQIKDSFFKVTSEGSSEIGRALNIHKKVLSETDHMVKGLAKIEGGMNRKQIDNFVEAMKSNNPAKMARFAAEIEDPKLKDYVLEFWYNSILSGPPTHAVNVISNTLWGLYQIPHRVHTILWDRLYSTVTGKERTRFLREVLPSLAGYGRGWKRGVAGAKETLRTGKLQEFETKWAQEVGLSSIAAWERSPSPLMRKIAPLISVPTRALRAMDVWANAIGYDSEMMAIATRAGIKKGLKGQTLKDFTIKFVKKPSEIAHEQAMKFAKRSTFMDDPDAFTAWFLGSRRIPVIGPASQFVVPFVNTIGNLTKRGLEFIPGVGIAKEAISRKMGRGMGNPELIAKQVEGALLSLYVLYKADQGDITGAAPQNEAERERFYAQGKKAWAIRLGGEVDSETGKAKDRVWVQYRRMEPYNTAIASVAIAYDNIKNAKDDDIRTKIFGKMVVDLKNNFLDSSYFQGLQQVFNRHQKMEQMPQRLAASMVPYSSFWRSMNRAYEKAVEGDVKVRERDTWLSAFAQVIPGLYGMVPAELTIWGEEKVIPGSILQHWLPYKWSKETQDPVEIELERLNDALKDLPSGLRVFPGQPSKIITYKGKKTKLSDKVYRDYLIDLGKELRLQYEKTINSSSYLSRSDERRVKMLRKRTTKIRARIRAKLLQKISKEKQ